MNNIEKIESFISENKENKDTVDSEPFFFDINDEKDVEKLSHIIDLNSIDKVIDNFCEQKSELEIVLNPKLIFNKNNNVDTSGGIREGIWVYFPWKKTLVHLLKEEDFKLLRTSRNFDLITKEEQEILEKSKIGIAGMNVGASGAVCAALEGVGGLMKFADFDELSVSNLNRFRAGVCELGINKSVLTARHILEINPYAKLELFNEGITNDNIEKFMLKPAVDVIIEEIDNLPLKISIRELAKKHKIPVVMVTGNGPNLILDIERFDSVVDLPILNGYVSQEIFDRVKSLDKKTPLNEIIPMMRDFVGSKFLSKRLLNSFLQVGDTLAGIPQLGETTFLRGAVLTYVIKRIILGDDMPSGRYFVNLDDILS